MNKYNEILTSFCTDDETRKWMLSPFQMGNFACATNAHWLVVVPIELTTDVAPINGYDIENVKKVIPTVHNMNKIISMSELKTAVSKLNPVPDEVECDCCGGDGEVKFTFYHKSKAYHTDGECPICEGEGILNASQVGIQERIDIGISRFGGPIVRKLLYVCETLNSDAQLLYQKIEVGSSLFKVDNVLVLLMSVYKDSDIDNVVHTIQI